MPETVLLASGALNQTSREPEPGGGVDVVVVVLVVFCTLTETCAVALRPSASNACALRVCVPFARVVVFRLAENGDAVSVASVVLSTEKTTRLTALSSAAIADSAIVPE